MNELLTVGGGNAVADSSDEEDEEARLEEDDFEDVHPVVLYPSIAQSTYSPFWLRSAATWAIIRDSLTAYDMWEHVIVNFGIPSDWLRAQEFELTLGLTRMGNEAREWNSFRVCGCGGIMNNL